MFTQSNPIVNKLYDLSEKSGEIVGKGISSILNTTTFVANIGIDTLKKGNNKLVETVSPTYNVTKDKLSKKIGEVVPEKYKSYFIKETEETELKETCSDN